MKKHATFYYLDQPNPRDALRRALAGTYDETSHMQLVELTCWVQPRHTLGQVITDAVAETVELVPFVNADGPRMRRNGPHLAFVCHACRHQRTNTTGTLPLARVIDLASWLAWSFPDDLAGPPARAMRRVVARRDQIAAEINRLRDNRLLTGETRLALRDRLLASEDLADDRPVSYQPAPWDR